MDAGGGRDFSQTGRGPRTRVESLTRRQRRDTGSAAEVLGWVVLMISHSTRLFGIRSNTFILTGPWAGPGSCASTRRASVSLDVWGAHHWLSPSAMASSW